MDKTILIIAGEPSGDTRGAELLKELKKLVPGASFWGIGGDLMAKEGVELVEHIRDLSIIGVWEAVRSLGKVKAQYTKVKKEIDSRKPAFAILIDYPGFNLKVASLLRSRGIPVLYYVAPQVWAWGEWRVRDLRRTVSRCLTLFAFEEKFLKDRGVDAKFVGNPLVDSFPDTVAGHHDDFTIALLPGSRKTEVSHMLPLMLGAAEIIAEKKKGVSFVIAESSNVNAALYEPEIALHPELKLRRVKDATFSALASSDFAIVTSGTATLETAMMEKPMVVTYRVALLTEVLFKMVSRLRLISLANIIAGFREIVPEFTQRDAVPEKVAEKVLEITNDAAKMDAMKAELREVKKALGPKGASRRAAEEIVKFAKEKNLL